MQPTTAPALGILSLIRSTWSRFPFASPRRGLAASMRRVPKRTPWLRVPPSIASPRRGPFGERRKPKSGAIIAALGAISGLALFAAFAATAEEGGALTEEVITVVATRTERRLDEVAATVSVKTAEQVEEELARNIADLVRFEPGVTVAGAGSRFGLTGFSIRGIGGNRVLTLIDGVRVPDEFSFGPFLSSRRDFVDIDSLNRVEIARGPISALYGSDALGGAVSFTTKAPHDLLDGRGLAAAVKTGYSSVDDSFVGTLNAAAGNDSLAGMVLYTRRSGEETDNQGDVDGIGPDRERPDPQSAELDNLTAKVVYTPSEAHEVTLGLDRYGNDSSTRILSDYGSVSRGTRVDRRDADDSRRRTRWWLRYRHRSELPFAESLLATLYRQSSKTKQLTDEEHTTPRRATQTRWRDSRYQQRIDGLSLQLGKTFATGGIDHQLSYGLDYNRSRNASVRNGGTFDADGQPVREFFPYPTRDFPRTKVSQLAVFLQDEITLLDGALRLSPGVRFDSFKADARADEVYLSGNPGAPTPEDYKDSDLTLKVGALYQMTDALSAYISYSQGFRAPPYDDVNVGFTNFIGGYKTIANPSLQSERSRGTELGLRFGNGAGNAHLALFRNDYDKFIEALAIAPQFLASRGIDPTDGLLTFQSVNRSDVRIQGVEFSGSLLLGAGLSVRAALAYAEGENRQSGVPLNSIEPLSATLGLGYESANERWGAQLLWTLAQGKSAGDIDPADPRPETAGYGVLDLLAHVNFGQRLRLNAGLFNITDKTYLRWADTAGIGDDAPGRFTQPGFNAGVSLRLEL